MVTEPDRTRLEEVKAALVRDAKLSKSITNTEWQFDWHGKMRQQAVISIWVGKRRVWRRPWTSTLPTEQGSSLARG